jgi:uncharacterized protein YqeY
MEMLRRLQDDMKQAMKAGDALTRDTLRLVIADLRKKELDLGRELGLEEELAVLQKGVKSREDSVAQYRSAQRADLVRQEEAEIAVIRRYLPRLLSEDETRSIVRATIEKLGVSSKKELGAVMKTVMAEHRGEVDGKLVQKLVGELLA